MELIDRKKAIEAILDLPNGFSDMYDKARIIAELETVPTVDAVEVVRCKDCKHRPLVVWNEAYGEVDVLAPEIDGKEDWRCPCLIDDDPYYSWSPNDNWFCADGERREKICNSART